MINRLLTLALALALALAIAIALPATAAAHAFDPALVAITERAPAVFDVGVRPSAAGVVPTTRWPAGCQLTLERLRCADAGQGLAGATVTVEEGEALVRLTRAGGEVIAGLARPDAPFVFAPAATRPDAGDVFLRYGRLGVRHILTGFDHLLLLLLLVLLVESRRSLLVTLTAFTVGHSVTLGLAATGAVSLPQPPVEALIALSLVVLARPLLAGEARSLGENPWAVALACGLLHGFGFAGALLEAGLPSSAVAPALLAFNLGVEAGQIAVVAPLLLLAALLRARHRALAFAAGASGAWLFLERTAALVTVTR